MSLRVRTDETPRTRAARGVCPLDPERARAGPRTGSRSLTGSRGCRRRVGRTARCAAVSRPQNLASGEPAPVVDSGNGERRLGVEPGTRSSAARAAMWCARTASTSSPVASVSAEDKPASPTAERCRRPTGSWGLLSRAAAFGRLLPYRRAGAAGGARYAPPPQGHLARVRRLDPRGAVLPARQRPARDQARRSGRRRRLHADRSATRALVSGCRAAERASEDLRGRRQELADAQGELLAQRPDRRALRRGLLPATLERAALPGSAERAAREDDRAARALDPVRRGRNGRARLR
jgi:hypothetical protein